MHIHVGLYYNCRYTYRMENFKIMLKSPTTAATTKAGSSSHLSIILAISTLAQFMTVVDFTIVQVALPSIGRESVNGLQWIVTAYGLTLAGFLLLRYMILCKRRNVT